MQFNRREKGFTLSELLLAMAVSAMGAAAGATLLRDYSATARTLRVQAAANSDLLSLTQNITRDFQTSRTRRRACVLNRDIGNAETANPRLNDFSCRDATQTGETHGIGFGILDGQVRPQYAYINTCLPYNPANLPRGRGNQIHTPPDSPRNLSWGGARSICPAACRAGFRPAIQFINRAGNLVPQKQVPPPNENETAGLSLFGAVLCASMFQDLREVQRLNGTGFEGVYMNVLLFIARARYDVLFPQVVRPDGTRFRQSYVWMTGGVSLDFLGSQEMSIFKCRPGDPGC